MVLPMHRPLVMAIEIHPPIDFTPEFTRRVVRHEQHLEWSLLAFAIAVLVAAAGWSAFVWYL